MDRVLAEFADVTEVATTAPGVVAWRARDIMSNRWVLIKRFPATYGKARTTHSLGLKHPEIVPARRWLSDSGYLYVVRDWVAGANLRDSLHDPNDRAFDRLRKVLDPVLDALEYAHAAGQAHGAVNPENVLISATGKTLLSDFGMAADRNGSRGRYAPPPQFRHNGDPTPRADFYQICEVYKEFLPDRSPDDEAGSAARARLIRNLSDVQTTSANVDELRYKLDAVTRIAELLGFCSTAPQTEAAPTRIGPKIVCQVIPPTAVVAAGSGTAVVLTVWNEGDEPLHIEAAGTDVVWLNYHTRFVPFTLAPDDERDLTFTLSAARLQPGTYNPSLLIRSNHGMSGLTPPDGVPWHQHVVALPVIVNGQVADEPPAPAPPMIDRLPIRETVPEPLDTGMRPPVPPPVRQSDSPGIACIQEPDPTVVQYGQKGVLHIGVKNIGAQRLRIDKVKTRPSWLTYPGEFQPVWIEPAATQYLGLSVAASTLTAGDYRAEVAFTTSVQEETEVGQRNVWREMKCEVRVRVVRTAASPGGTPEISSGGCATLIAGIVSLLATILMLVR
jgi:serine/threonine protein kinase